MPKLKKLPENAYEILCAELARATTTPFGAWCAPHWVKRCENSKYFTPQSRHILTQRSSFSKPNDHFPCFL